MMGSCIKSTQCGLFATSINGGAGERLSFAGRVVASGFVLRIDGHARMTRILRSLQIELAPYLPEATGMIPV